MNALTVVGIGNRLFCDDGIGCEVAQRLNEDYPDRRIEYLVGETDINYCLSQTHTRQVILVDAVKAGCEPGSVHTYHPKEFLSIVNNGFSMHNLHLLTLLNSADSLDIRIIGIEPYEVTLHAGLSKRMEESVDRIVQTISKLILK
jgi:hydrogenase maturation protease